MKKILVASLIAACASMGLTSCMNGDYDANPATTNSGGNPLNPPGGSSSSKFDWEGTAPMSVKVDGSSWGPGAVNYLRSVGGLPAQVTATTTSNEQLIIAFPETTPPNTVVNFDASNFASFSTDMFSTDLSTKYTVSMGGSGAVQILENDASHVKGKFYFNAKNTSGATKDITEGYFDVTK